MKTTKELLAMSKDKLLDYAKDAYWGLKGVSEWPHASVQVEIREDSDGLYELRACSKCGVMWTWHTKHGEHDYPYELCRVPDPIPGSLADVAFAMQLYVNKEMFERQLAHLYEEVAINDVGFRTYGIFVGPTQRIIAAVLVWEAKDEKL